MNTMTTFESLGVVREQGIGPLFPIAGQGRESATPWESWLLTVSVVCWAWCGVAQQSFELTSSDEVLTGFRRSGNLPSGQLWYSADPGVGGLPGRLDAHGWLDGLFSMEPFVFVPGRPLLCSTYFFFDRGQTFPGYVWLGLTDTTQAQPGLYDGSSCFVAAVFPAAAPALAVAAKSSAVRGGSYAACDETAVTTGWYELSCVWTHAGSNLFNGTATLYSVGPRGTGPRVEIARHSTSAYIPKLDVAKPVYFALKAAGSRGPYLDNICIASEPSGPVLREVAIDSLHKDGWLTWRSTWAPGYYGLECAEDVNGEWRPSAFWNLYLTGAQNSLQLPLGPSSATKLFFRVLWSQHELPLPRGAGAWDVRTNRGTVRGKVTFWEGDFMPPGTGTITPVKRPIFVFEKARLAQTIQSASGACFYSFVLSSFVDSTESGEDGYYEIALPPGDYSVFVLERSGDFYANEFDATAHVNPVTVQTNQTVTKDINITYKATF